MPKHKNTPDNSQDIQRISTSGDIEVSTYLEISQGAEVSSAGAHASPPVTDRESIVVIDFGSQYSMLIARRIRECNVYCEIVAHDASWEKIKSLNPKGFILSGGPSSVYQEDAPLAPSYIYESHLPVLGICYGM